MTGEDKADSRQEATSRDKREKAVDIRIFSAKLDIV